MSRQAGTKLPIEAFVGWLANGERGISSEAIVSHLTGLPVGRNWGSDYPADPDDFRRCQALLERVPLARLMLPLMATRSPEWARLVAAWDDIAAAILAEAPEYMQRRGSSPAGYRLMRSLIDGSEVSA